MNQFPKVVKERCLEILHDKSPFVLIVSIFLKTTYMTTGTEKIARKQWIKPLLNVNLCVSQEAFGSL